MNCSSFQSIRSCRRTMSEERVGVEHECIRGGRSCSYRKMGLASSEHYDLG